MVGVRLGPELERRLDHLAKTTGRSKSYYIRSALVDKIEDFEDYASIEEYLKDPDQKTIPLDEVMRSAGLVD